MTLDQTLPASYRRLAQTLDSLPQRFPPADDDSDIRLLAKIFTPEEADLAAQLLPQLESSQEIASRLERDHREVVGLLKEMSKKGQINMGKTAQGRLGFGLMPFVIGIYEAQGDRIDTELANLFEVYFKSAFGRALEIQTTGTSRHPGA
jgi:Na+-translocating ferredoxin:NAD+ oxidoreductase subunit B